VAELRPATPSTPEHCEVVARSRGVSRVDGQTYAIKFHCACRATGTGFFDDWLDSEAQLSAGAAAAAKAAAKPTAPAAQLMPANKAVLFIALLP